MGGYKELKDLSNAAFRRHTGVERETFEKMMEILKEAEKSKNRLGGKPNILSMEERLLMSLEYLREYRTFFHIANSHGVSEATCYRNCVWVENILVASKEFRLPSRKEMIDNHEIEIITVDAAETPIQRPQKNSGNIIRGRKSATR